LQLFSANPPATQVAPHAGRVAPSGARAARPRRIPQLAAGGAWRPGRTPGAEAVCLAPETCAGEAHGVRAPTRGARRHTQAQCKPSLTMIQRPISSSSRSPNKLRAKISMACQFAQEILNFYLQEGLT